MKRIAFLISGGDAPGINACLAGIAAAAGKCDAQLTAIPDGFDGLLDDRFLNVSISALSDVGAGGSLIPTARSGRFLEPGAKTLAVDHLRMRNVDGLIVLGGDGSAQATADLATLGVNAACVPVTIDNDLWGTDYTLGFDTVVQQIYAVLLDTRATAAALRHRVFFVETLGGQTGHLALAGGLAGGADLILVPELRPASLAVAERVKSILDSGQDQVVIVAGEGLLESWRSGDQGIAFAYGKEIERTTGVRTRVTVMGYYMRGGPPTAFDSLLGQMMGAHAVQLLCNGCANRLVVFRDNCVGSVDIAATVGRLKALHPGQLALARQRGCLVP